VTASEIGYVYTEGGATFTASPPTQGAPGPLQHTLPPWSITVIDAKFR
jgi:hypothetical protein